MELVENRNKQNKKKDVFGRTEDELTEAGVLGEELGEPVALVLVVAAVAAVAVRRHADFGRAQVVGRHHGTCGRLTEEVSFMFLSD